jgi:hypothetical protein
VSDFLPGSLEGWLAVLAQIVAAAGIAWKAAMLQVDQRIRKAEDRVVRQINGLGGRVRKVEVAATMLDERTRSTEADLKVLRDRVEADARAAGEKWGRLDERSRRGGGDAWGGTNPP